MRFLISFFTLVFLGSFNSDDYHFEPKDKTKYYFTNTAYNFFALTPETKIELTKEERKLMLKTTGLSNADIDYVLERCQKKFQPEYYRRSEKFIMYRIYSFNCEQLIKINGSGSQWTTYALLYIKTADNKHMPPAMLSSGEDGFFLLVDNREVSTTPVPGVVFKPATNEAGTKFVFGFGYHTNNKDSVVVTRVQGNGPAYAGGLRVNDLILSVNAVTVPGKNLKQIGDILAEADYRGNQFLVKRNGSLLTLSIDRDDYTKFEFFCKGNCDAGECEVESVKGFTIKGECKNGKMNGNAIMTNLDGRVFYVGDVKDNQITGTGKYLYENKDIYEGEFLDGYRNGMGTYFFADGKISVGFWQRDRYFIDSFVTGFPLDRFTRASKKAYLYDIQKDFTYKVPPILKTELQKLKDKYDMSDHEINKLISLCDFKYKPENLNTPSKVRAVINKYQGRNEYDTEMLTTLEGLDGQQYTIVRVTYYGSGLPEEMRPGYLNQLFFCIPSSEVRYIYFSTYSNMKLEEAEAAARKAREQAEYDRDAAKYEALKNTTGIKLALNEKICSTCEGYGRHSTKCSMCNDTRFINTSNPDWSFTSSKTGLQYTSSTATPTKSYCPQCMGGVVTTIGYMKRTQQLANNACVQCKGTGKVKR
jgi:hypothetical protein